MEIYKKKGLELISNLALSNNREPAVVRYYPQKTKIGKIEAPSLPRIAPENAGISSSVISSLISELEAEPGAELHSMMIVKDGNVIAECARDGYSARLAHLSHSMSKTVTGMLIGILIDDGKINTEDTVASFFPEYDINPKTRAVSIENLLTMSSAIGYSEIGSVTDTRWSESFLAAEPSFKEGEKFAYNSMNSYMLMAIAHRIINRDYGMSVEEFLRERLLSPLDITEFFWEKGPEDIEKGGWGLYLSAESWAKLGIMMLSGGTYRGKRILSESFVTEATSTKNITPEQTGDFNYGYQLWVARSSDEFLFNGMLGQNVLVIPKNNIVVAINSGNNELFSESPALKILRKYLSCDIAKPTDSRAERMALKKKIDSFYESRRSLKPKEKERGLAQLFGFKKRTPFDTSLNALLGQKFIFTDNNHGILPAFVRGMQNNYQGGIDSFEFVREGEKLFLIACEGGVDYRYEIGVYGYSFTDIDYCGELYRVGALMRYDGADENGKAYKIQLIYPELPNVRTMTLILSGDGILTVMMSEKPDSKITESFISSLPAMNPKIGFALNILESNLGKNFIEKRIAELFSPTLIAVSDKAENFDTLVAEENRKIREKFASMSIVRMMISKFTGIKSGEDENKKAPSLGGMLLSSLFGKLFSRGNMDDE